MTDTIKNDGWVSVEQAASILGVSAKTIWRRIKNHKIESKLEGGNRYVCVPDLHETDRVSHESDIMTDNGESNNGHLTDMIDELRSQLKHMREQLSEKDEQISQLHQIVAMGQTNVSDLTRQVEDLRDKDRQRWWQFWR